MKTAAVPSPAWLKRYWGLIIVVGVLLLIAAARLRTRDFPLERDEGEYAYAGQLMLQGIPPYELAYNMKFPGTYGAYAVIMAFFGQTPVGIHLGLLCVTSLNSLMLYWLGRRLLDEWTGVGAALTGAFLSASPSMFGFAGHATHFLAFFIAAGLCLLWLPGQPIRGWKLCAGGFMFGLAVIMKQHAIIFCLWGLGLIVFTNLGRPRAIKLKSSLVLYNLGVALPFALTCLVLWRAGVFPQFWFWTISYAREYVSAVPLDKVPAMFNYGFLGALYRGWLFWIVGGLGIIIVWRNDRFQKIRPALLSFLLASFLTTCPGFFFRTHYFLVMIPALSLLAGCAISAAAYWAPKKSMSSPSAVRPALVCGVMLIGGACENHDVWFNLPPDQAARGLYGLNLFPEAEHVSEFIRTNSVSTDTVAILGSEPEIYFLSQRRSATGFIYTYPLMELQPYAPEMQKQMIQEIEHAQPRFVILADSIKSWLPNPQSDTTLLQWWNTSYHTNYSLVGLAEIISLTESRYSWGPAASTNFARSKGNALIIYERNSL